MRETDGLQTSKLSPSPSGEQGQINSIPQKLDGCFHEAFEVFTRSQPQLEKDFHALFERVPFSDPSEK